MKNFFKYNPINYPKALNLVKYSNKFMLVNLTEQGSKIKPIGTTIKVKKLETTFQVIRF